ncbi:hypothetical protein ACLB1M_27605 [Escherichia coli]
MIIAVLMGELAIAISTVLPSTPPESPRPKLEGHVESRQLRLADLGPLIGVDSGKGAEA